MTDIQPDLFGGSAVIGASRAVQREEADQCLGQVDVFALIAEDDTAQRTWHTESNGAECCMFARCTVPGCDRPADWAADGYPWYVGLPIVDAL